MNVKNPRLLKEGTTHNLTLTSGCNGNVKLMPEILKIGTMYVIKTGGPV
jgi:hypothetical protein